MRRLLLCLLAFFALSVPLRSQTASAPVSLAPPTRPCTEAQVREYLAKTHALDVMRQMLGKFVDAAQATGDPTYPAGFWAEMRQGMQNIDFVHYLVPAYQKYISQEDMAEILNFYGTPAGQRILASQKPIEDFSREAFRAAGAEVGKNAYLKHADEIEAAKARATGSASPNEEEKPASAKKPN